MDGTAVGGARHSSDTVRDDEPVQVELLRGSVRSRTRQARPALAAMVLIAAFTAPLLGGGIDPWLLAGWLATIVALLVMRVTVARRAERDVDGPVAQLRIFDRQFRVVSLLSQTVTGAGIWLVWSIRETETAGYVMTLLVTFYGVGTLINLAHDFRTVRLSLPLLMTQPVLYWLLHGVEGIVIAVILAGLLALMLLSARNSQHTFNDSVRIRFEKDALLRQLEREKQVANEALREAERANRAKSFFMASASHDLRQPLYAATILADTLALHPLEPHAAALVAQQREALGAASGLFDNLLDLSRFESGVIEPKFGDVRLSELLQQMGTEFAALAGTKGLYLRLPTDAPDVASDYDLLSRLLRNLVSNAIRYTNEGGVTVAAEVRDGTVWLSVADTGIGIARHDQERVFQEFVQVDNPQRSRDKGVGLGLAIVRHIATLLRHEIDVESAPGVGTRFTVRMPLARGAGRARPTTPAPSPAGLHGRHVWIVEDDVLVRDALRAYFAAVGSRIEIAEDRNGLEALERRVGLPDCVILDDMLGGAESGLDLARWLAGRMPAERLLLTTGNPDESRWSELVASGFTTLRKPLTAAMLDEWVGGWAN